MLQAPGGLGGFAPPFGFPGMASFTFTSQKPQPSDTLTGGMPAFPMAGMPAMPGMPGMPGLPGARTFPSAHPNPIIHSS